LKSLTDTIGKTRDEDVADWSVDIRAQAADLAKANGSPKIVAQLQALSIAWPDLGKRAEWKQAAAALAQDQSIHPDELAVFRALVASVPTDIALVGPAGPPPLEAPPKTHLRPAVTDPPPRK